MTKDSHERFYFITEKQANGFEDAVKLLILNNGFDSRDMIEAEHFEKPQLGNMQYRISIDKELYEEFKADKILMSRKIDLLDKKFSK